MEAMKCDRCGRYYDKTDYEQHIHVYSVEWVRGRNFDLCPDCMGKLARWLRDEVEK